MSPVAAAAAAGCAPTDEHYTLGSGQQHSMSGEVINGRGARAAGGPISTRVSKTTAVQKGSGGAGVGTSGLF